MYFVCDTFYISIISPNTMSGCLGVLIGFAIIKTVSALEILSDGSIAFDAETVRFYSFLQRWRSVKWCSGTPWVDEASSRRDERIERAVEKKKEVAGGRLLTGWKINGSSVGLGGRGCGEFKGQRREFRSRCRYWMASFK